MYSFAHPHGFALLSSQPPSWGAPQLVTSPHRDVGGLVREAACEGGLVMTLQEGMPRTWSLSSTQDLLRCHSFTRPLYTNVGKGTSGCDSISPYAAISVQLPCQRTTRLVNSSEGICGT